MADIVPFRRREKLRKSPAAVSRWKHLPWQPLAFLIAASATLYAGQFLTARTGQLSTELMNRDQPSATQDSTLQGEHGAITVAMPLCHGWPRMNCVIDGDTIWYEGTKIRIADINAPETHDPKCTYEADLGKRATERMIELLNTGPFEVVATGDRDEDVYGRKLRVIERNGHSLGQTLVAEGLAERWQGYRRNWCA